MYVFRERTTLKRWNVDRVAFMTCVFSDLIAKDYQNFCKGIKKYTMDPLLLQYGKGELPSHGRTQMLWNVDVDRMYVPVWVNCNHWIALCISFVTRNIQVFDCGGRKKSRKWKLSRSLFLGLSRPCSHWQYRSISTSLRTMFPMYLWVVLTDFNVIVVCTL